MTSLNVANFSRKLKSMEIFLKQEKRTFYQKSKVNMYTDYNINLSPNDLGSKFTLLNYFFGAVKLT